MTAATRKRNYLLWSAWRRPSPGQGLISGLWQSLTLTVFFSHSTFSSKVISGRCLCYLGDKMALIRLFGSAGTTNVYHRFIHSFYIQSHKGLAQVRIWGQIFTVCALSTASKLSYQRWITQRFTHCHVSSVVSILWPTFRYTQIRLSFRGISNKGFFFTDKGGYSSPWVRRKECVVR